jgi:hypothetical protein
VIVRYFDAKARPLRQLELCEWHVGELPKGGIAVRGMSEI